MPLLIETPFFVALTLLGVLFYFLSFYALSSSDYRSLNAVTLLFIFLSLSRLEI